MREPKPPGRAFELAVVLSGGNALGAYQAGAYQALHDGGFEPDRVAGASIGAVNGALICGNPSEDRIARLRDLWMPARDGAPTGALPDVLEETRRTAAVMWALAGGRSDLFTARSLYQPWWGSNAEPSSLLDATPLSGTLERLVDFDLLNRGVPRFSAGAVDIETGEDVVMDTSLHRIDAVHIRASAALLPAFAPVEVGGRMLGDAGISANLPLDCVLGETSDRPVLCIALDLLPLNAPRPDSLGDAASRMQDLMFATQSRRALAAWQAIYDERTRHGAKASVTVLHVAYSDQGREVSGKAFDFSPTTTAARWQSGYEDLIAALADLDSGKVSVGSPGLTVYSGQGTGPLKQVCWPLAPIPMLAWSTAFEGSDLCPDVSSAGSVMPCRSRTGISRRP